MTASFPTRRCHDLRRERLEQSRGRHEGVIADFAERRAELRGKSRRRIEPVADRGAALRQPVGAVGDRRLDPPAGAIELVRIARTFLAQRQRRRVLKRTEERRVGTEGVSTCRSRWSTSHLNKNKVTDNINNHTTKIIDTPHTLSDYSVTT